ncbi:MAG: acetyl-CoA C-acetyltransferase [Candidatus Magnetoovum sp. WYHC-5]|nr:acetyl-CoA C-acetyltransferase [Candidatus Magnetoovum sp. WYHC-5]
MKDVVVVSGARTAVGAFGGFLKDVSAIDLGALVLKETLKKVGLRPVVSDLMKEVAPDKLKDQGITDLEKKYQTWDNSAKEITIDDVIMGNVVQAGQGQNPARQAMIRAGICKETPAMTINKVCSSGLKAVANAWMQIQSGESDVVLAGGMESMSNIPFASLQARWGYRMALTGVGELHDLMVFDGLYEIFYGYHMGITAENIVDLYGITRQEQDEVSLLSHQRARKAIADGLFKDEIVPVVIKDRKGEKIIDTDERPMDTDMEKLAKMKPAFKKDGSVTAGNASGINDGAASVLLMTADKAKELGLEPFVTIRGVAAGGIDPAYMGLGPIPAVRKLLKKTGVNLKDVQCLELNEAFASQAIACMRELGLEKEQVNELGSGISIGHPIGCTGARQLVTAMHNMKRKNYRYGLITMCIGGGMGFAMLIER